MSQQRQQPGRVELELQGPGRLSDLGQQVRQSARRSWDPQVAPLHKTMSTQTEPSCGGEGCVYMVRGSSRRHRLHLHGARPSKEMQMVCTQEETPQSKECCVLKGQASAKGYRLRLYGARPSRQMQTASTQSPDLPGEADRTNTEQRPRWRHRQHQHQGLWLCRATQTATAWSTALPSNDGWSSRERGNARRRRLHYLWMRLFRTSRGSPWRAAVHPAAGWVSTERSFLRRRRRMHARLSEEVQVTYSEDKPQQAEASHSHNGDGSVPRCKPCLQGSPATSGQGETPEEEVSCVNSCPASRAKLCLQKPELCVETQAGSAQRQPMAAQDKAARSSDEAASTQDETVSAQDEGVSVPNKVVPGENEARSTQNEVVPGGNHAVSPLHHTASTENEALQGTATWPTGDLLETQPISTVCTALLGTATWISTESPAAPNYSQYMDEPGLLVDMQPVCTWSVAPSWISMEQRFTSGLQLFIDDPGLYLPALPVSMASTWISSDLATARENWLHLTQPGIFVGTRPVSTPSGAPQGTAALLREAERAVAMGCWLHASEPCGAALQGSTAWVGGAEGGCARAHGLIPPEPGCQLQAQPMSALSAAQQGPGCGLIEVSARGHRLHLRGAQDHVQGPPASMPTTVLLRNTSWMSAVQRASTWERWQRRQHLTIAEH